MRRVTKLVAVMASATLALAACGGSDDTAPGATATTGGSDAASDVKVGMAYDVGGRGDQSFNDSAAAGLDKAADEFGVEIEEIEAGNGDDDAAREERLRLLADGGFNPVIAVGFAYSNAVKAVATEFPEVNFAIVDDSAATADNIANLVFAEEQGSYLVGVIAAQATKSNNVGFVGGVETELIKKFEAGYTAGVKAVKPDAEVQVSYISPAGDFSGFSDPAKGRTVAQGQLDAGADVVYHAAGGSGSGVFEAVAAAGEGNWAIGVDSDQYQTAAANLKPFIVTSMLKRVDTAVYEMVKASVDGSPLSGVQTFDLEADGVGYATSNSAVEPFTATAEEWKAKIVSGEVTVPTAP